MQNKYLKFLLIALVVAFIIPQITLAAWWNPFSWGFWSKIFHSQTQQSQPTGCTLKAETCPDGSTTKRIGPCEFSECPKLVGGDKDSHGCIGSAGYTWCEVKNKCLRIWEEKCEKTVDQTAEWKIFTNENAGYEIKYPQDVSIDHETNTSAGYLDFLTMNSAGALPTQWRIEVTKYKDGLTVQQRAEQIGSLTPSRNKVITDVVIGGVSGKKVVVDYLPSDVEDDPSVTNATSIFVAQGGNLYEFYCLNKITFKLSGIKTYDSQRFDQMLSTFKFTK